MKRRMLFGLIAGMVSFLYGEVVYENDFSTRTSVGAIPTTNWYEMAYHVGVLARNYNKNWNGAGTPYEQPNQIQDGWALANIGRNNNTYVWASSYVATNSLEEVPEGDSTNQFYKIDGVIYPRSNLATHPIGNEFTNGVLRLTADMRAPAVYVSDCYARVMPLFRSQMNALDWSGSYQTPAAFGMQSRGSKIVPFLLYGDGDETAAHGDDFPNWENSHAMGRNWYRFVTDIDLDAKRVSCSVYQLGLENPTPETQGTLVGTRSNKQFYRPLTAERGAISGIGILTYRTFAEEGTVTNAACFDNLSVAWKAPGTTDFQLCYENDFNVRRCRTLTPPSSTTGSYDAAVPVEYDEFSSYILDKKIVPDSDLSLRNKQPQPLGFDNWRRINDDGTGQATVVDSGTSYGHVLRMTANSIFVCVSQPLGEDITSGKVRMSADIRLPDQWHWTLSRSAAITMGTTAFASTLHMNFSNDRIGNVGIGSNTSNTEFHPACNGDYDTSVNCVSQNWYRVIQTADLYEQKYDYEIYHLTTNGVVDGEPVSSASGMTFSKEVRSIGAFALFAYAPGSTMAQAVLFDNVKIWKNVDTAQEVLVYSNDFTTRKRLANVARTDIAPVIDRPDSGVDSWARRNNGTAQAFVQTAANPALAIVGAKDHAYVFHPLGTTVGLGKVLKFSVDLRPSRQYAWTTAQGAAVLLGDDAFLQGNRNQDDSFGRHASVDFGFKGAASGANAVGLHVGSVPYVASAGQVQLGEAIDTSHWYRFRVTAPVDGPTYSVKLYDMGASHPEMTSADGALVSSFDNLAYANGGPVDGFSGFSLAAYGVPGFSTYNPEDPDIVLFDNVCVDVSSLGFSIIFR